MRQPFSGTAERIFMKPWLLKLTVNGSRHGNVHSLNATIVHPYTRGLLSVSEMYSEWFNLLSTTQMNTSPTNRVNTADVNVGVVFY